MRPLGKLKDIQVRTAGPGIHGDGGGLVLSVKRGASGFNRGWLFRYSSGGRQHWMGLGAYPDVTLQRARQKAQECRRQLADGIDPLVHKRSQRASLSQQQATQAKSLTFDQAADQYITSHRAGWRSIRHAKQWGRSLELYVSPIIGSLSVAGIDTSLVMRVLEPIWLRTPELATHVRQRIEAILDWATVREYRQGANPARWRGHLDKLLPSKSKVAPVQHHRSLPYDQVSAFLTTLRQREAMAARALEFIILTAARAGEALGMTWGEVDFATKVWTVPASRMKAGREHRVPLSPAAVALLEKLPREGNYVFTGGQGPRLSPMAIKMLLIRMNRRDFVTHGFRSSFRDWAAERTSCPSEVAEMALAHRVGSAVENAYRRTDMFERRRRLMADWAVFCETPASSAEVIPIRA